MRILSGVQPSRKIHIGNYFGAIRQFVELQGQGESLYFIADLHALTSVRDGSLLREYVRDVALDFLALGIDPQKSILFRQSDVAYHAELYWLLGCVTPMSMLERGTSYKDKTARGLAADLGLFAYPALQAADIVLYGADQVPVGKDQKQHIEFARDIATKFNTAYVKGYDPQDPAGLKNGRPGLLKLPDPYILDTTAVVPGTDGQKMSKSYGNVIELFADDKAVKKQIMGIVTDSTPVESPKDPTDNSVFLLLKLFLSASELAEVETSFRAGGTGYGAYKKQLLEAFHAKFDKARARRAELVKDPGYVDSVLKEGAERASALAEPLMNEVRKAVGIR